jgi:hypothetical protein
MAENDYNISDSQWRRYEYSRDRGHRAFIAQAKRCEEMYLGAGKQWSEADRKVCETVQGRKCVEVNTIFTAINTVLGEQVQGRADIAFKPRAGDATQEIADTLSKLVMQICDEEKYPWLESEVFADGIIQQRGYFDLRVDFDDNLKGDVRISVVDPLEVIPDPDAQNYDTDKWKDVIVTKWMSIDEIEQVYGKKKADEIESFVPLEPDFGVDQDGDGTGRNRFGGDWVQSTTFDSSLSDRTTKRVRVIDRQHRRMERQQFFLNSNMDLRPVPAHFSKEQIAAKVATGEWQLTHKVVPRIRWTVTTRNTVLFDDWSPYQHFTIVPFFPYFRRGQTRGLIDNAISPQEMLNKAISQFLHIVNTTANSGWMVEKDSMVNMTAEDLQDVGMKTGLVIEYERNATPPAKIQPNAVPPGHDRLSSMAEEHIMAVTGVSRAEKEANSPEESGVAYQAKQFQAKMHLSVPLDNLARTRTMLAIRILDLIQAYYTEERIIMITRPDDMGENRHEPLAINQQTPEGEVLNNLTLGEYDVVVSSVPQQATFQNTQFQQLLELRQIGVQIPDTALVQVSSVAKKQELIKQMSQPDPAQVQFTQEMQKAELEEKASKTALNLAQADRAKGAAIVDSLESMYTAGQTAQVLASMPGLVPVADELFKSAGGIDKNAAPVFAPTPQGLGIPEMITNSDPRFPANPPNPAVGMNTGIETARPDGIRQ